MDITANVTQTEPDGTKSQAQVIVDSTGNVVQMGGENTIDASDGDLGELLACFARVAADIEDSEDTP
ncbi:Uncharacterised protein [Mycobacteroides abscessus subsp. massiliense]|uniref:hypothetical protein n=1 Tax=Mycobacteroides abscessus TaxID=36809 RepID=UPI0009273D5C|nr:hypothetical protein [Mycobacteroides abscessus]SHT83542.1 Uncharacterised protein [Mycobacteroides abscessus subsp. abscessus]SKN09482.1 Uncharacterised protein [Mycobacteroides abscessus subsp. massiliense]SKO52372.1 Uncharacterised protein [Mycobacteroides abscessus subsp. abscessus]SLH43213.1 Uncharacterised protein [Mycobacteroides abscessus subsp. massiliense]